MKAVLAVLAAVVLAFGSASPASAGSTRCADGTISDSPGGSGTCSWHGGIHPNDYSYSPPGSTTYDLIWPATPKKADNPMQDDLKILLLLGAGAAAWCIYDHYGMKKWQEEQKARTSQS